MNFESHWKPIGSSIADGTDRYYRADEVDKALDTPKAWMRRWAFDGEVPAKKLIGGRLKWEKKHLMLPVTRQKIFEDDVPLYAVARPSDCGDETQEVSVALSIEQVLDTFERKERGIPQAHIAAELVAEIRRVLPECGTPMMEALADEYYPYRLKDGDIVDKKGRRITVAGNLSIAQLLNTIVEQREELRKLRTASLSASGTKMLDEEKCEHCDRTVFLPYVKPDNPGGTHWDECWRAHHACAIHRIESLLSATPERKP